MVMAVTNVLESLPSPLDLTDELQQCKELMVQ